MRILNRKTEWLLARNLKQSNVAAGNSRLSQDYLLSQANLSARNRICKYAVANVDLIFKIRLSKRPSRVDFARLVYWK